MPRLLPLLALCLLLFATACEKDNVAEPALEGRWNHRSILVYVCDKQGNALETHPGISPTPYYLVLTSSTQERFDLPGAISRGSTTFTRQGNQLTFADGRQLFIVELTPQRLTLHDKNGGPSLITPGDHMEADYIYER
jgi:hypothetical protein